MWFGDGEGCAADIGSRAATRVAKERAAAPTDGDSALRIAHNPKTMKTAMPGVPGVTPPPAQ